MRWSSAVSEATSLADAVQECAAKLSADLCDAPPDLVVAFASAHHGASYDEVPALVRAERENLRVRVHPRDIQGIERSLTLLGRRLLLSIFAASTAIIAAIIHISLENVWVLAAGLLAALVLFLVVLVIPAHLLDNPLRHARGLGSRSWRP